MLKALRKIIQGVSSAKDLRSALDFITAEVSLALHADACTLYLIDEDSSEYVLMAAKGVGSELIGKLRIKFGQGLVGLVGEREELINLEKAHNHAHFYQHPLFDEQEFSAYIGVPIIEQGELLGVLAVQRKIEDFFTEEEEAFLVTLTMQLAGELDYARAQAAVYGLKLKPVKKSKTTVLIGLTGSPGIAIGRAVLVFPPADLDAVPERELSAEELEAEINFFKKALELARDEVYTLQQRARRFLSVSEQALFEAYAKILDSHSLIEEIISEIRGGQWAQGALKRVIKQHVLQFESLDDLYLQERAHDLLDLGRRILAHLQSSELQIPEYPKHTVLVSEEVSAAALMEVPQGQLVAILSSTGSSNSHVAILARALGVPTITGISPASLTELEGKEVVVDGYNGEVYVSPTPTIKKEFKLLAEEERQLNEELESLRDLPTKTQDNHGISLLVNTGLALDADLSLSVGAEGVGLYRTEMLFMVRSCFPTEEEQRVIYRQLLNSFSPRSVVMRTLDIGGDKSLPYFPIEEENPFLGWRGIRVSLDHPPIFLQQIRAMLQASSGLNNLSIMLPMISSVSEVDASKRFIKQAYDELLAEGIEVEMPRIGLMVEVPAAVYQAHELASRVDFLSVGSNDLIQYLLAVDRNNARVVEIYDGFHPAVLRALKQVADAARKAGKPISICGELASDPIAVVLLMAMGYDSLSMNARALPRVKWVIRHLTLERAKELLQEILAFDDAKEVRCHMELALEELGLASLIRAGR